MVHLQVQEKLDKILDQRKRKVESIEASKKELLSSMATLQDFQQMLIDVTKRQQYFYLPLASKNPELSNPEHLTSLAESIKAEKTAYDKLLSLEKRFSRQNITIAVVGKTGAGKSTFLQGVSGLLNSPCIPAFSGAYCTGAPCTIENELSYNDGEVLAEFTFKDKKELLKELNSALERIVYPNGGQNYVIKDFDDFANKTTDQLRSEISSRGFSYNEISWPDFAEEYIENRHAWIKLLAPGISKPDLAPVPNRPGVFTSRDEKVISSYVSKFDGASKDALNRFYRFVAVKDALIKTKFAATDVQRLRLIDTVGFGETEAKDQRTCEVIKSEADAVIFILGTGDRQLDDADCKFLNNHFYDRFKNSSMGSWMALVINLHVSEEAGDVRQQQIALEPLEKKCPSLLSEFNIVEAIHANVSEEVRGPLSILLDSIYNNLENLDVDLEKDAKESISHANEKLHKFQRGLCVVKVPSEGDIASLNCPKILQKLREDLSKCYTKFTKDFEEEIHSKIIEDKVEKVAELLNGRTLYDKFVQPASSISQRYRTKADLAFGKLLITVRNIGKTSGKTLSELGENLKRNIAKIIAANLPLEGINVENPNVELLAWTLFEDDPDFSDLKSLFLSISEFRLDELAGIVKILVNSIADKHISPYSYAKDEENSSSDGYDSGYYDDEGYDEPFIEESAVTAAAARSKPFIPAEASEEDIQLTTELEISLNRFLDAITETNFYHNPSIIPIAEQILAEINYFRLAFEVEYTYLWFKIFNNLVAESKLFKSEHDHILKSAGTFEKVKAATIEIGQLQPVSADWKVEE
ncbi:MAG: dynamin family protein [Clostridiales bacterium]|jgi:energy-coupling factor transporter ATP-binding protein EcfA2|nr:dynamin family protein [Clostridiales bacterium]